MAWIFDRLKKSREQGPPEDSGDSLRNSLLQEEQQENLQLDMAVLEDDDGSREEKLAKVAEKEVQSAAEVSIKKLHVIRMGRCPVCGAHLSQHLFAGICEACGWHDDP
jgi:DNA repair exonuclease SbcCD ATPase subunit